MYVQLLIYIYIYIYIYISYTMESSCNQNSNTLGPDWPQNDPPRVACVVAQQYSSAAFVS
jgi:hypothetical protein